MQAFKTLSRPLAGDVPMTLHAHMMVGRDVSELGRAADQLRVWLCGILDEDSAASVELALVEALTNSILHGPSGSEQPIGIFVEVNDAAVVVEIADGSPPMPRLFDGAGQQKLELDTFDIQCVSESGRGLSLIVLSVDEVSFVQDGDQVRLRMVRRR
jgi:anti-sigma regulatory factor (Ser/Thr protein kinase)